MDKAGRLNFSFPLLWENENGLHELIWNESLRSAASKITNIVYEKRRKRLKSKAQRTIAGRDVGRKNI